MPEEKKESKKIGFLLVIALSISAALGTTHFFGPAIAAQYSGPSQIIAWVIMLVFSLYVAAIFGEMSAMFPTAGGTYEFSKIAFGRFISFLTGWLTWLIGNISEVLMVIAAIDYLVPYEHLKWMKFFIAIGFILFLNYIVFRGIEATAIASLFFSAVVIILALTITFGGATHIDVSNFIPFFTHGYLAVFVTIFFIAEAFFGWEQITFFAEEVENPQKVIPMALLIGTLLMGLLGIALTITSVGVVKWDVLVQHQSAPISFIGKQIYGAYFSENVINDVIAIGIYLTFLGGILGGFAGLPRLLMAMARDKLFPHSFSWLHKTKGTPYRAIILQTIVSILFVYVAFSRKGSYETLLNMLVPLGLMLYCMTMGAFIILRYRHPKQERPFKVPFGVPGAFLVVMFFLSLIVAWVIETPGALELFLLSISISLIGIPIYFLMEMYYDPRAIALVNDILAHLTFWTESFILPKSVRKELIKLLGDVKGKKILEVGCSVGSFTMFLAEEVGPKGKIYATDISKHDIEIAEKRLKKEGHKHVTLILHDDIHRVHKKVPDVNATVSIGMLGYLQETEALLDDVNRRLDKGEKILFMDYDKFFYLIPNTPWLRDNKEIEKVFANSGFKVRVDRKQGLLWQYIYIYGTKVRDV
ncbi:MAG: amino acid permease [Candidatus Woesearchaeota archaeon]